MKTEKQTRQDIIDKQLLQAGWMVGDRTQVIEEFEIDVDQPLAPNYSGALTTNEPSPSSPYKGHQYSDYVLLGRDGRAVAVVEAKKTSKDAALGREQAKQYCYNIQKEKGGELPFCFYTNGLEVYFWDLGNHPPRKVVGFPTLDDLERFQYIRRNKKPLSRELINSDIAGRDYQIRSIRAVLEGIEQKKGNFLLVMATGTGKIRTRIALAGALMRAGHDERVLFLVDRIALREQALAAFKEHLPNEPRWPKVEEKLIAQDRRIYVSTYPTMLNIIRDEDNRLSPHFFDLLVVDESHRSTLMKFRELPNPGDGPVQLDLTDQLHNKEMVEFGPGNEAVSVSRYREMVEALVLELTLSNPILQKIKNSTTITAAEAEELAETLHREHLHITENLLRIIYQNRKARFIQFIRHILGIEVLASFPDTVTKSFDQFIAEHTNLNSRQLDFLSLLKDFIIEREKIEKRDLIQSPFTIIHPQGISGVFRPSEIEEILQLTEKLAA